MAAARLSASHCIGGSGRSPFSTASARAALSSQVAIGQLFDYRHLEGHQEVELGILVPEKPPADLLALLGALEIACIWQVAGGFNDTRGGTFC